MNKLIIEGVIGWDVDPKQFREQLQKFSGKPVTIEINSPGGFVFDGIQIFNDIINHKGEVTTINMSLAASMASYILLAGDIRQAMDNSTFMMHNVIGIAIGNHNDFREAADIFENLSNIIALKYSQTSGKDIAEIKKMMDADTYLFGDQQHENGFVSEMVKSESGQKQDEKRALALARYNFSEAMKIVNEKSKPDDLLRAAAIAGIQQKPRNIIGSHRFPGPEPGTIQNQQQSQEHRQMTLAELLAQNPAAKIEHEHAVEQAEKNGAKAEREANEKRIEEVKPYLTEAHLKAYPASAEIILDVMKGDAKASEITRFMAVMDKIDESHKSAQAQDESAGHDGAAGQQNQNSQGADANGDILTDAALSAEIARKKAEQKAELEVE